MEVAGRAAGLKDRISQYWQKLSVVEKRVVGLIALLVIVNVVFFANQMKGGQVQGRSDGKVSGQCCKYDTEL